VLEVEPTEALNAAEEYIIRIVDKFRIYLPDWVDAIVLLTLALLLGGSLSRTERFASCAVMCAVLSFALIWCSGLFLPNKSNASSALQHVIIFSDFGHQVITGSAVTNA
jgi:hypothetical protein